MSDWPWVVGAYALTWTVLGLYALRLHRDLARARRELDEEARRTSSPMEEES